MTVLIDVRSESEYQKGHIPGAINIPLLDDSERRRVGLVYKQFSKHAAMELGLHLFARKAARFVEQIIPLSGSLVVYCARGGFRSLFVAEYMRLFHPRVKRIKGGYKAYRLRVKQRLEALANHPLVVLNGETGSGKTEVIHGLQAAGFPVIDFEGLAHHRGSIFGGISQPYPPATQQQFENQLAEVYLRLQYQPLICVEIENAIGPVQIPIQIRRQITTSPMILLQRSQTDRIQSLLKTYAHRWSAADIQAFEAGLNVLKTKLPSRIVAKIQAEWDCQNLAKVCALLLAYRYDSCYGKSIKRHKNQIIKIFNPGSSVEKTVEELGVFLASLSHKTRLLSAESGKRLGPSLQQL